MSDPEGTEPRTWEQQGCAVCRRQWESGERPQFVAESIADRSRLYRCDVCGTWWLSTERYAVAVEEHEISGMYGESLGA